MYKNNSFRAIPDPEDKRFPESVWKHMKKLYFFILNYRKCIKTYSFLQNLALRFLIQKISDFLKVYENIWKKAIFFHSQLQKMYKIRQFSAKLSPAIPVPEDKRFPESLWKHMKKLYFFILNYRKWIKTYSFLQNLALRFLIQKISDFLKVYENIWKSYIFSFSITENV